MEQKNSSVWAGLVVIAGFLVGIAGFFAAILAVFNDYDYVGAGLCLLASALIFGLLANSILRD